MKPNAIVYTSKAGHTRQYALLLSEATGLPVYSLREANARLHRGSPILYMGWICANQIKGYAAAAKKYEICAVCGVGLCDTGAMLDEVREKTQVTREIPLFTLLGGIDGSRLKGAEKLMISMLARGLAQKKERSEQEERMLQMLSSAANYVSPHNLTEVLRWIGRQS